MQSQARQRPLGNSHSTCVYSSKVTVGAYSALWWMEGTPKATVTENQIKRKEWSYRLHLGRIWGGGEKRDDLGFKGESTMSIPRTKLVKRNLCTNVFSPVSIIQYRPIFCPLFSSSIYSYESLFLVNIEIPGPTWRQDLTFEFTIKILKQNLGEFLFPKGYFAKLQETEHW